MRSMPNIAEYGLISKSRGSIERSPRYRSPSRFTATATCFDFPWIVSAPSTVYLPSVTGDPGRVEGDLRVLRGLKNLAPGADSQAAGRAFAVLRWTIFTISITGTGSRDRPSVTATSMTVQLWSVRNTGRSPGTARAIM